MVVVPLEPKFVGEGKSRMDCRLGSREEREVVLGRLFAGAEEEEIAEQIAQRIQDER